MTPCLRKIDPFSTSTAPWPAKSVTAQPFKVLPSKRDCQVLLAAGIPELVRRFSARLVDGAATRFGVDGAEAACREIDRSDWQPTKRRKPGVITVRQMCLQRNHVLR